MSMPHCSSCDRYCNSISGICHACHVKELEMRRPPIRLVAKAWLKNAPDGVSENTVARWPWLVDQARRELHSLAWAPNTAVHRLPTRSPTNIGDTYLFRNEADIVFFLQASIDYDGVFRSFQDQVIRSQIVVPLAWEARRHRLDALWNQCEVRKLANEKARSV